MAVPLAPELASDLAAVLQGPREHMPEYPPHLVTLRCQLTEVREHLDLDLVLDLAVLEFAAEEGGGTPEGEGIGA